ncbi:MAG: CDC48 family AAA ATPase [Candidatus ainarchaeum sp.]|nr:CDC48 family AAA ATPase [Candidatus ainarchaeum sp.]
MVDEIELIVQDPDPTHVGRNIITLDKNSKLKIGVTSGDIVEIEGKKKTAALVWPAKVDDVGKEIVRMDSFIRHNAGVALSDKVKIRKCVPREAKRIVLAPIEEVRIIASGYDRILKKSFLGRPLTIGDNVWVSVFGSGFIYKVVDTQPRAIVKVTDNTEFSLKEKPVADTLEGISRVAYEDIGGLTEQVKKIREMVELPMKHPELFQKLGVIPPKGILLYGAPGTGKTLLAKAVANEAQVHLIYISAPEVMGKFVGEAEERVRKIFKEAQDNAPSLIFIDEIDAIASKRDEVVGEVERRVVAQLLSLMDGLAARGEVIVMAATNRINSIDEALRRPGRFDREIEVGVPDKKSRKQILNIHTRGMPLAKNYLTNKKIDNLNLTTDQKVIYDIVKSSKKIDIVDIFKSYNEMTQSKKPMSEIADILRDMCDKEILKRTDFDIEYFSDLTHGFVGADLQALTKEAAMKALRRYLPEIEKLSDAETIPIEVLTSLKITKQDFLDALKDVSPSGLREFTSEIPNVLWEDIGALEDVKDELKQAVEWPIKHPTVFKEMGIVPPKGVLLYGPPGTGKTMLAKAVATESGANFISIKGPELLIKWVGDSSKAVKKLFRKARQLAPCIVFIDEIDSIAYNRNSDMSGGKGVTEIINQLLTELDGVEALRDVVFIAATNRPDLIDKAMLRPGRLDKLIMVPVPNEKSREEILKVLLKNVNVDKTVSLKELTKKTEGFSGADLSGLIREAALLLLKENKMKPAPITMYHINKILEKTKPTIDEESEKAYSEFKEKVLDFRPTYVG